MGRIIGNIEINRKNKLHDELMQKYNIQNTSDKNNNDQTFKMNEQQDPYENIAIEYFKSNIDIRKNGQKIEKNDYYGDFKSDNNSLYTQKQKIYPTNEDIEQVDPNEFFGKSLNGIVNKF